MGRFPMAAALALILSTPLPAGVEVTKSGDRLDVMAAQAPVSEVLDGLARKTRMKVIYDGAVPRTPVTVDLRGRTQAEAVLGVLEGLGLNYALVLDASGTEVDTLMIVGTGARTASASVRPPRSGRAPHANPENPDVESEEPSEVDASLPVIPQEVPAADENPKAAPAVVGPPSPPRAFPTSPFAPGAPAHGAPSPSPPPPSS
jgi:hypothetical protein